MTIQLTVDTSKQLTTREKFILKAIINADEMVDALNEPIEQEEKHEEEDVPDPLAHIEEVANSDPEKVKKIVKSAFEEHKVSPTGIDVNSPVILKRHGKYRDKICLDCKKVFTPKSGRQDRCPECREKHLEKLVSEQRARQKQRRHAASEAKKVETPVKTPEKPTTISCKRCHKSYTPAPDDKNGYCPKCLDKIRNAPKLKPLNSLFTVREVLAMPVVERYRYAFQWSYKERQEALSLKPIGALTPEEHEFFIRCQTGDFMDD